ncbi:helix-turn-helix domain-containing protein [Acidaminobacter hydrogenoformans]|uniref:MerR HTH family regulatory protein n=1 Tax=Acidaminobacter hydrogenoformans DSM 2784 TaxID=1120920 RepID=A0A1G5S1J0_9FIRM|nr:helix-turn-helix domain-containing protein [Acidaminobacter hydrogenoformans]SCZ79997.1 MerR HTH family regulatory protein [Acidaminobacter hydrogenoformans DSM 2784]
MTNKSENNAELFFSINEVAKLLGVVPATVRNWEKQGFFIAKRSSNTYRIYSLEDIETLKKIKQYSIDDKMGSKAIKSLLMTQSTLPPLIGGIDIYDAATPPSRKLIGSKWKLYRDKLALTLEEVAKQVGISTSYLSKIENGQANISYEILERLAAFYGESVLHFFEPEEENRNLVEKGTGEPVQSGIPGVTLESLISQKEYVLFPMMFYVEPGAGAPETHQHHGEEFIYVVCGNFRVTLNHTDVYEMYTGDSMYFKSTEFHSWMNPGKKTAQVLWVHSPVER